MMERRHESSPHHNAEHLKESKYYDSLAQWLEGEGGIASRAIRLGGSLLPYKWSTPDVIGVSRPALAGAGPAIISAEIKCVVNQSSKAVAQAIFYKLFSHFAYAVIPDELRRDALVRLSSVAQMNGVGLILFTLDPFKPRFRLVTRATAGAPCLERVDEFKNELREKHRSLSADLFEREDFPPLT